MIFTNKSCSLSVFLLAYPMLALAQVAPDAGRLLQEQQRPPQPPREAPEFKFELPASAPLLPGGATVKLSAIRFTGNSIFDTKALHTILGEPIGQTYDLAGLRNLADQISGYYRANGYPFARAYLPPQSLSDGQLQIDIVEGRYGSIRAVSEDVKLREASQAFLDNLQIGDVIESKALERTTLILDDQPGLKISPIIRPGKEVGTGDLEVYIQREAGVSGDVGFDNHGNRFTGEYRARANLQVDSPFLLGDQFTLRSLYSDERMWLGSLGYSLPLGAYGVRVILGYAHTFYQLAKDYARLDATGTADVASLGASYPLLRSQRTNLTLAATWQHKKLNDKQSLANTDEHKSSDSLPVTLSFDHRDDFLGGGITYGSLAYMKGHLKLDSTLENTDRSSGQNTQGSFGKLNLDVARIQATPLNNLSLFGRFSAQQAGKNLDSSEGFSLGGANGVRAYPSGEGSGDEGWLLQLEVRYAMGIFTPYTFYDAGYVRFNANPHSLTNTPKLNHRSLAGEGIGVRYSQGDWSFDASLAWQSRGGKAQSDSLERNPRFWASFNLKL